MRAAVLACIVACTVFTACSRESAPAAAPPAPPPAVEPTPVPAEPPPAPALPPPPASVLRDKLLAAQDLESFRALLAEKLAVSSKVPRSALKPFVVAPARLDQRQWKRIQPLLPREPDPAEGEGEDFACDDAANSCVFRDADGNATTYAFSGEARLHEIRKQPPPKTPKVP